MFFWSALPIWVSRRLFRLVLPDSLALKWSCPPVLLMTFFFLVTTNLLAIAFLVFIFGIIFIFGYL